MTLDTSCPLYLSKQLIKFSDFHLSYSLTHTSNCSSDEFGAGGFGGSGGGFLHVPGGGSRMPATIESVNAKQHYIMQDGKKVFRFAVKGMADVSEKILAQNKLTGDNISLFIPHQANKPVSYTHLTLPTTPYV